MAVGLDRSAAPAMAQQMGGAGEPEMVMLPLTDRPLIRLVGAVHHRWQRVSVGLGRTVPVAFDLPAVDVAARWLGITPDARLLDGLTIIEREALKLMRTER